MKILRYMKREESKVFRIIHFEVPVSDPQKASEFFTNVFGWNIKTHSGSWGSITTMETGAESETGVNGSFFLKSTVPSDFWRIINSIEVDDLESILQRVKNNGGNIIFGPIQYANLGRMAYFRDPEGNILGLFEKKGGL